MRARQEGDETAMATAAALPAMSAEEWTARQELAACYRIFAMLGWDELIYNHITLRVPGEEGAFLINPFGLGYDEVCASNLVKVDIDGNRLDANSAPINPAGFLQHSLVHRHRADAHCVIHTHSTAGLAVAATREGLSPTNFYSAAFAGRVAYHDFEGVTIRPEEGERLVANLGDKRVMILRNHGLLVLGPTLPATFFTYWLLQRACEVQVATGGAGTPLPIPDEVLAVHRRDLAGARPPGGLGTVEFDMMVRRLDRIDRGWRE